jgi:ferric-dicitrate binding protein FerR (iron transport regulator)
MNDSLNKYVKNECSEDDLASVIDLFVSPEKQNELEGEMQAHWNKNQNEKNEADLQATLYKIHYDINTSEKKSRNRRVVQLFTRVAAVLFIPMALALGYQFYKSPSKESINQTITTPLAARTSFELPDGSKVWLNAGSTVTFASNFGQKSRSISLSGQAYFDVKKDKIPFEVETKKFAVRVLGTAFDVLAYPGEESAVTLERGKVEISTASGAGAKIRPGQRAVIDQVTSQISTNEVNSQNFVSWKDNRLIFNDEPLYKVSACLERWYNLKIEIKDESIRNMKINGTIEYESINEVIDLLSIAGRIDYTFDKNNRHLILKAK